MAETRTFKNTTKKDQVYYDRHLNPITLRPGRSFIEDMSGVINVNALIQRERDRKRLETDVEEAKRMRGVLTKVKFAKSTEELDKLRINETNQDVLDAILVREKEILDDSGRTKGKG